MPLGSHSRSRRFDCVRRGIYSSSPHVLFTGRARVPRSLRRVKPRTKAQRKKGRRSGALLGLRKAGVRGTGLLTFDRRRLPRGPFPCSGRGGMQHGPCSARLSLVGSLAGSRHPPRLCSVQVAFSAWALHSASLTWVHEVSLLGSLRFHSSSDFGFACSPCGPSRFSETRLRPLALVTALGALSASGAKTERSSFCCCDFQT